GRGICCADRGISEQGGDGDGFNRGAEVRGACVMQISRGFQRRHQSEADPARVPRGHYATTASPVLSAGPTPHTPLAEWSFTIRGAVDAPASWTWDELRALPSETFSVDIHCVTKGSKID